MSLPVKDTNALIQRLIADPAFRARVLADAAGVIAAEGYTVDAETLARLEAVTPEQVEALVAQVDTNLINRRAAA